MSEERNINETPKKTEEKLPFAKNEIVRLMKDNLDSDKMITRRVKEEMNKFLYSILQNVCKQLHEMLEECIYPYTNIKRINKEKEMILKHLDAIKSDCDALSMDVEKTLKSKDVDENDSIIGFT